METNDARVRMRHFAAVHALNIVLRDLDDPVETEFTLEHLWRTWRDAGEAFLSPKEAARIVRARRSRLRRFWNWFRGGV